MCPCLPSTLLYPVSLMINTKSQYGQYRDHLVGQLTNACLDLQLHEVVTLGWHFSTSTWAVSSEQWAVSSEQDISSFAAHWKQSRWATGQLKHSLKEEEEELSSIARRGGGGFTWMQTSLSTGLHWTTAAGWETYFQILRVGFLLGQIVNNYLANRALLLADLGWVWASLVVDGVPLAAVWLKGVNLSENIVVW